MSNSEDTEWANLYADTEKMLESVDGYAEAAEAAGSPVDRRLAVALSDIAKAAAGQAEATKAANEKMESLAVELESLSRRIDRLDRETRRVAVASKDFAAAVRQEADSAIHTAMADHGEALRAQQEQIANMAQVEKSVAENYEAEVSEAVKRLKRCTGGAMAVWAAAAILGGILAAIGAFFVYQVFPPVQNFIAAHGWGTVVAIVAAALAVVWLIGCGISGWRNSR